MFCVYGWVISYIKNQTRPIIWPDVLFIFASSRSQSTTFDPNTFFYLVFCYEAFSSWKLNSSKQSRIMSISAHKDTLQHTLNVNTDTDHVIHSDSLSLSPGLPHCDSSSLSSGRHTRPCWSPLPDTAGKRKQTFPSVQSSDKGNSSAAEGVIWLFWHSLYDCVIFQFPFIPFHLQNRSTAEVFKLWGLADLKVSRADACWFYKNDRKLVNVDLAHLSTRSHTAHHQAIKKH